MESRAGGLTTVCASQNSAWPDATLKMFCTSNDVAMSSETPLVCLQPRPKGCSTKL